MGSSAVWQMGRCAEQRYRGGVGCRFADVQMCRCADVQRCRCRGGAEIVKSRRCRMQSRCRGTGSEVQNCRIEEVQMGRRAELQRCCAVLVQSCAEVLCRGAVVQSCRGGAEVVERCCRCRGAQDEAVQV